MKIKTVSKVTTLLLATFTISAHAAVHESGFKVDNAVSAQPAAHVLQIEAQPEFLGNDFYQGAESIQNETIEYSILGESADEIVLHVIDDAQQGNLVELNDVNALKNDPRMQQLMNSPEFQALMQEFK